MTDRPNDPVDPQTPDTSAPENPFPAGGDPTEPDPGDMPGLGEN